MKELRLDQNNFVGTMPTENCLLYDETEPSASLTARKYRQRLVPNIAVQMAPVGGVGIRKLIPSGVMEVCNTALGWFSKKRQRCGLPRALSRGI